MDFLVRATAVVRARSCGVLAMLAPADVCRQLFLVEIRISIVTQLWLSPGVRKNNSTVMRACGPAVL
jgi:hypothetical protein